jgi:hypothetical protein
VAEITLSGLQDGKGYKEPVLVEGFEGDLRTERLSDNTEDDLKILLKILPIQNIFPHSYMRLGDLCLDINRHKPSTHCRR